MANKNRLKLLAILTLLTLTVRAQEEDWQWRDPDRYLAARSQDRDGAIKELHLGPGRWVVAVFSTTSDDEQRRVIDKLKGKQRVIFLVKGTRAAALSWKTKMGLRQRVVGVGGDDLESLGISIYPTLLRVENGRITGEWSPV